MFRLLLAIFLGKIIIVLTRALKYGGGSAAPGYYGLKICPNLVSKLSKQIPQNVVITGTNGKTTTARFLAHFSKAQNLKLIKNSTGSNLERGVASSLIEKADWLGVISGVDLGIWELDEAAFNKVVFQIKPQIVVFLNAFRDQLDRYGEVDAVVSKWWTSLEKIDWNPVVLINGNDGNTIKLGSIEGINSSIFKIKGDYFWGEKDFDGHLIKGDFEADIKKTKGMEGTEVEIYTPTIKLDIDLPIPGIYHVSDLLASLATYYQLNLPLENINEILKGFSPAFGRVEKIDLNGHEGFIFLIKNPAGASLVFDTVKDSLKKEDRLFLALNDNFADGTDVSWIWDAQFENLLKGNQCQIIVSGTRSYDLANRLKYGGAILENIIIEPDLERALKLGLKELGGRIFIMPTYTALLSLQKILTSLGYKAHYWKEKN